MIIVGDFKDTKDFKELRRKAGLAMKAVGRKVILDHRATGNPIIVCENGKVVEKNPWDCKLGEEEMKGKGKKKSGKKY